MRWTGGLLLYWPIVLKRELSWKMELLIYHVINCATFLTDSHLKLWLVTNS